MKRLVLILFLVFNLLSFDGDDDYEIEIGQVDVSQLPEVTMYVNVTDSDGKPVTNLTQDDFTVYEDGEKAKITEFAGIGENRPVDIVFVFDTTGSMDVEINGAINSCTEFAENLEKEGRDYRLGLITFGDEIRGVYNSDHSLTSSVSEFKTWLSELIAEGGGDDPENTFGALKEATQMNFREDSQVLFLLITDDQIHYYGDSPDEGSEFTDPDLTYENTLALLTSPRQISVYPIAVSWVPEFQELADDTNGTFYDLEAGEEFTNIIDNIGAVLATQYKITYTTPRPDYDGTRRNIEIEVGGSTVSAGYLEPHLINLKSNIWVGLGCLAPLGLALVIPFAIILFNRKKSPQAFEAPVNPPVNQPVIPSLPTYPKADVPPVPGGGISSEPPVISPAPAKTVAAITCAKCGNPLKPGARFCNQCGSIVEVKDSTSSAPCPKCGTPRKQGARFCPTCGSKLE
jgi:predicted RNA-binding Zn-ribbon protein involved in translation (DUF1610 family)